MAHRITAPGLQKLKANGSRIVCVTAYDVFSGSLAQEAEVDVVLVGDSLGNVVLGYETTIPVTMDEVVHHLRAVRRVVDGPLLVADLPFGSYNVSTEQAVKNSIRLMKEGAEAVKLEGDYPNAAAEIMRAGIPVMGHVGFTPQSVHRFGGFKVQGKGASGLDILSVAKELEASGVFSIVLELIPSELSLQITNELKIPTIGIGAGRHCSGEIQVFHDIMGLSKQLFKHTSPFVEGRKLLQKGMSDYVSQVRNQEFPKDENSF